MECQVNKILQSLMLLFTIIYIAKIVLIKKQQKQAVIQNLRTQFQKVPMIPELYLIIIMHVILLNTKARVNVVEREQPAMLSVDTDILRNKGE